MIKEKIWNLDYEKINKLKKLMKTNIMIWRKNLKIIEKNGKELKRKRKRRKRETIKKAKIEIIIEATKKKIIPEKEEYRIEANSLQKMKKK